MLSIDYLVIIIVKINNELEKREPSTQNRKVEEGIQEKD